MVAGHKCRRYLSSLSSSVYVAASSETGPSMEPADNCSRTPGKTARNKFPHEVMDSIRIEPTCAIFTHKVVSPLN